MPLWKGRAWKSCLNLLSTHQHLELAHQPGQLGLVPGQLGLLGQLVCWDHKGTPAGGGRREGKVLNTML